MAYLGFSVCWGLGAGGPYRLGHLAQGQAKLNVAFQLTGVEAVALAVRRLVKLEKPELDRALGEGGVEVKHMVAAVIVMVAFCRSWHPGSHTKCRQGRPWWWASCG